MKFGAETKLYSHRYSILDILLAQEFTTHSSNFWNALEVDRLVCNRTCTCIPFLVVWKGENICWQKFILLCSKRGSIINNEEVLLVPRCLQAHATTRTVCHKGSEMSQFFTKPAPKKVAETRILIMTRFMCCAVVVIWWPFVQVVLQRIASNYFSSSTSTCSRIMHKNIVDKLWFTSFT